MGREGYDWVEEVRNSSKNEKFMKAWQRSTGGKGRQGEKKGNKDGKGERKGDKDGKGSRKDKGDRMNSDGQRWKDDDHEHQVPMWAAVALTALSVSIVSLLICGCCFYRFHKKAVKYATA